VKCTKAYSVKLKDIQYDAMRYKKSDLPNAFSRYSGFIEQIKVNLSIKPLMRFKILNTKPLNKLVMIQSQNLYITIFIL